MTLPCTHKVDCPLKVEHWSLPLFSSLFLGPPCSWWYDGLRFVPAGSTTSSFSTLKSSETQSTCDGSSACRSVCSVIYNHSSMSRTVIHKVFKDGCQTLSHMSVFPLHFSLFIALIESVWMIACVYCLSFLEAVQQSVCDNTLPFQFLSWMFRHRQHGLYGWWSHFDVFTVLLQANWLLVIKPFV